MKSSTVIFLLPFIAALCAFTLPGSKSGVRTAIQSLFAPVAWPVRAVGTGLRERLLPTEPVDVLSPTNPRSISAVRAQNVTLLTQVANLSSQLDELRRISAAYAQLGGDLRRLIEPASVTGGPTDQRQVLTISTSSLRPVREGTACVLPQGYVGRVEAVSAGFARVLLVTDPSSRVGARFARFVERGDGRVDVVPINIDQSLVTGQSRPAVKGDRRRLTAGLLPPRQVRQHLRVGDAVLLDDPDAIPALKGLRIGTVSSITLPPTDAGFAEVTIDPVADLPALREVLVVTGR